MAGCHNVLSQKGRGLWRWLWTLLLDVEHQTIAFLSTIICLLSSHLTIAPRHHNKLSVRETILSNNSQGRSPGAKGAGYGQFPVSRPVGLCPRENSLLRASLWMMIGRLLTHMLLFEPMVCFIAHLHGAMVRFPSLPL